MYIKTGLNGLGDMPALPALNGEFSAQEWSAIAADAGPPFLQPGGTILGMDSKQALLVGSALLLLLVVLMARKG